MGQRRPGHKYSVRMCVTGGITNETFEKGLEGCWEDLSNNGPASAKGESMRYIQVTW